jgi:hypothetical protein
VEPDAERLAAERDALVDDDAPTIKRGVPATVAAEQAEALARAAAHRFDPRAPNVDFGRTQRLARPDLPPPTQWRPHARSFLPPPVVRRAFVSALQAEPPAQPASGWRIALLALLLALLCAAGAWFLTPWVRRRLPL